MASEANSRRTYLDILRIMASFLVCLNHSDAFHIFLDQEADGSVMSWINVILPVAISINIPMFFMISGGLLLGKEESYHTLFYKRIWRFTVLLVSASFIMYLISNTEGFALVEFIKALVGGNINLSYWYLYAYLGFLVALPFLRKIAKCITASDVILLISVRTILIPVLMIFNYWCDYFGIGVFSLSSSFSAPLSVVEFFFYPMIGYYLTNLLPMEKIGIREVVICFVVLLGGIGISAAMTYHEGYSAGFTQNYLGLFSYSSAIAVFVIVRYVTRNISFPQKVSSIIASIGRGTLGVYLLEPMIAHYFYHKYFGRIFWKPPLQRWGYSVLWCLVCMFIGISLTYFLRKLPRVKKYL